MKIEEITSSDKFHKKNDYRSFLEIKINDKTVMKFCDGEPEDNNLCRNFSDAYNIVSMLKEAYEAGKNGETFEVSERQIDDFEF
jgi:hypothetical protein